MKYYRELYVFFILIGIVFYMFGLVKTYELVEDVQEFIPVINVLSQMRFSYRVLNASLMKTDSFLHLSMNLLINVTWEEKLKHRGPELVFLYKGNELERVKIESLDKPVTNKEMKIVMNISSSDLNETIYLKVKMNTSIGGFEFIQPITNVTSIIRLVNLGLRINYGERKLELSTQYRVKIDAEILYYDKDLNLLGSQKTVLDIKPSGIEYVDIPSNIPLDSVKYVGVKVFGVEINRFKIGD